MTLKVKLDRYPDHVSVLGRRRMPAQLGFNEYSYYQHLGSAWSNFPYPGWHVNTLAGGLRTFPTLLRAVRTILESHKTRKEEL